MSSGSPRKEALSVSRIAHGIDRVEAVFDDGSLVADAGLLLAGTLMARLGLEALVDEAVRPPGAGRGSGAKVLTLVASMLAGGSFIGDADRLRAGSAGAVLGFAPAAPSTLGTWLRSFSWGHVRQLDRANELALARAQAAGAAPDATEITIDVDSTVCEVFGKAKGGAAYGHTKVLGYHPLVAARDDTGEFVHSRMRSGASQRGQRRFIVEALARMGRLEPEAKITVRADSGFFSYDLIDAIEARGAFYVITIPHNAKVKAAVAAIDDNAWKPIAYTRGGEAQVAETTIETGRRDDTGPRKLRLIDRRTRLTGPQAALWPDWRHHSFITNRDDLDTAAADAYCRDHARVELAIKDLKANGLAHCPSGKFTANAAWLGCAVLAHNLTRWTARAGRAQHPDTLTVAATQRHRLINLPARLVNRSGRHTLRLPAAWPWAHTFTTALRHIRNLPQLI